MNLIQMAWRNLWRHPTRSGLILTSVAIGLGAGLFVLGLYRGMMESRLRTVIDSEVGHVQIHVRGFKPDLDCSKYLSDSVGLFDSLRADPAVRLVGKRSLAEAMLVGSSGSTGVIVQGVSIEQEHSLSKLSGKMIERASDTSRERMVLIGKKLADKQKLRLGSKVVVTVVDVHGELVSTALRVKGIFESSNTPFDERYIYIPIDRLNELLGIGANHHEYVILLYSDDSTDAIVRRYQQRYPQLLVEGWRDLSPETDLLVSAVDAYSFILLVLVFIALSFGIVNTLLMSVLERRREFGMMMALGMDRVRVFSLVMWETFWLVMAGLPVGVLGAWIIIDHYHRVGIDFSRRSPDLMRSFGFESVLHPSFPADRLWVVAFIVFVTAFLSGLFPAWRALRLNPAEVMQA